eukprot:scaffold18764_cov56-Isochrysis_galbana.AAC.1
MTISFSGDRPRGPGTAGGLAAHGGGDTAGGRASAPAAPVSPSSPAVSGPGPAPPPPARAACAVFRIASATSDCRERSCASSMMSTA